MQERLLTTLTLLLGRVGVEMLLRCQGGLSGPTSGEWWAGKNKENFS